MSSSDIDLHQFVREALLQIIKGVKDVQADAKPLGAMVNPNLSTSADHAIKQGLLVASGRYAQLVQFDVALSVRAGTGTKGGIGVFVGPVTLGTTGQSNQENSSISRVKFFVPLTLPEQS